MKRKDIYYIMIYIIFTALAAVFVYQALRKVFGHSWQIEILVLVLIASTLAVAVSNRANISEVKGEFRPFKRSFWAFTQDFNGFIKEQQESNGWPRNPFRGINPKLGAK